MSKKEIIDILERIIRCNAIMFFGYNTVAPGYEALQEAIVLIDKQDKVIDKMADNMNAELDYRAKQDGLVNLHTKEEIIKHFYTIINEEAQNDKEGDLSKNKENGN